MDNEKETKVPGLVSIIVPVYQVEEFLPLCVRSVQAQTYSDWELILVDDGSRDGSGKLCDDYAREDSRIVVIHQKNQGVSAARNAGLDRARGEYVAFVDADDYIKSDYLEVLHRDIVTYGADIACCSNVLAEDGVSVHDVLPLVRKARVIRERDEFFRDMSMKKEIYWANIWAKLYKNAFVQQCRFQPMRYGEDGVFMFDLFLLEPVVSLNPYEGYYYIRREGSAITSAADLDLVKRKNDLDLERHKIEKLPRVSDDIYRGFLHGYASCIHGLAYAAALERWEEYAACVRSHAKNALGRKDLLRADFRRYLTLLAYTPGLYRLLVRAKRAARK